jgi:hypothetical protein
MSAEELPQPENHPALGLRVRKGFHDAWYNGVVTRVQLTRILVRSSFEDGDEASPASRPPRGPAWGLSSAVRVCPRPCPPFAPRAGDGG